MNQNELYTLAVEASIEAGVAVNAIYNSKIYNVELKADDSPVTRADKTSSEIIASKLRITDIPIIDEEHCCPGFEERESWNRVWLVDPMDGTREFISGNGEFTINIALVENGVPVFGVIYSPVLKLLYWGGEKSGSFRLEQVESADGIKSFLAGAKRILPGENTTGNLRIAASRSHLDDSTRQFISSVSQKYGPVEFLSKGSSLKLCMIAEGTTDLYPRFSRTMEWDTAAGHAIVKGTGGVLLHRDTLQELTYNKPEISNPSFFALSATELTKKRQYF